MRTSFCAWELEGDTSEIKLMDIRNPIESISHWRSDLHVSNVQFPTFPQNGCIIELFLLMWTTPRCWIKVGESRSSAVVSIAFRPKPSDGFSPHTAVGFTDLNPACSFRISSIRLDITINTLSPRQNGPRFQMHFMQWKLMYFDENMIYVCFRDPIDNVSALVFKCLDVVRYICATRPQWDNIFHRWYFWMYFWLHIVEFD